jgi:predicted nucleotidyltransferase
MLEYNLWKNITTQEKIAFEIINEVKNKILLKLQEKNIIAIFVGGSFIRREMIDGSDIDIWTIVKKSVALQGLQELKSELKHKYSIPVGISGYSLWELKTGKISLKGKKFKTPPPRFVKSMPNFAQVYGKPLLQKGLFMRSDIEDLHASLRAFKEIFIPKYRKGDFGFAHLIKQLFWIIESELKVKQIKTEYSWRAFAKVLPKEHIIHELLILREGKTTDEKKKEEFIKKAERYVDSLKKLK